ncbi:hypothetical protein lerEdw1_011089 [Lerista edwardsae]|nr:hypothetical protein lerEdw1_011089 [Lerista edwardsae]
MVSKITRQLGGRRSGLVDEPPGLPSVGAEAGLGRFSADFRGISLGHTQATPRGTEGFWHRGFPGDCHLRGALRDQTSALVFTGVASWPPSFPRDWECEPSPLSPAVAGGPGSRTASLPAELLCPGGARDWHCWCRSWRCPGESGSGALLRAAKGTALPPDPAVLTQPLFCFGRVQGLKEETPERPKGAPTADKAGWIKRSTGGFLGLWKERYVLLSRARLLVYEDEDEQKCIETVELEGYDKCQDLRALLKRRNRFILIRAPGHKVQDIKFQASSGEEKESWMKALNEGISRGKNKVFDEVKVDEGLSLEHITRGRAKVGHGRRPPTRSHLKETFWGCEWLPVQRAVLVPILCRELGCMDGILRLDLDVVDNGPPNASVGASETENDLPPRQTLRPPMPPSKALVPPTEKQTGGSTAENPETKKPPMPPTKPLKEMEAPGENPSPVEEAKAVPGEGAEEPEAAPDGDRGEDAVAAGKTRQDPGQAPAPPPKVLSDKAKVTVTWDGPTAEAEGGAAAGGSSSESLQDAAEEVGNPPAPPPKILSERLKASMSPPAAGPPERHLPAEDSEPPENGLHGDRGAEPLPEEAAAQDGGRGAPSAEDSSPPSEAQTPLLGPVGRGLPAKPRCASVGDLLTEPGRRPPSGQALPLAQMEEKVACEQERTERLLQQVLQGALERAQEGNGPPADAETLLHEAAAQLRQASQVLREIRDLGGLGKEPAERRKEVTKDLATLYRRSAP